MLHLEISFQLPAPIVSPLNLVYFGIIINIATNQVRKSNYQFVILNIASANLDKLDKIWSYLDKALKCLGALLLQCYFDLRTIVLFATHFFYVPIYVSFDFSHFVLWCLMLRKNSMILPASFGYSILANMRHDMKHHFSQSWLYLVTHTPYFCTGKAFNINFAVFHFM